jgi:cold shock protein
MLGTIVRVNLDRGFGFVRPEGDRGKGDHFFHRTALVNVVFDERLQSQPVEFDSVMGDKGLVAHNVRRAEVNA